MIWLKLVKHFAHYLSEHLWKVIDIGGAQGLRLETLRLKQVLGDIWRVDEHAMQWTLLISIRLKHDLIKRHRESLITSPLYTNMFGFEDDNHDKSNVYQ